MLELLGSVAKLVVNTATVVAKPVEVAVDLANAVVNPVAKAATVVAKEVKELTK